MEPKLHFIVFVETKSANILDYQTSITSKLFIVENIKIFDLVSVLPLVGLLFVLILKIIQIYKFFCRNCSSRCSGDFKLICGGFWTISIYRPPPNQSEGFEVSQIYQYCKPWCKTEHGFPEKVVC